MRQHLFRSILCALSVTSMALLPVSAIAKGKSAPPAAAPADSAAKDKVTKFPFHGKLSAVDEAGKTFTVEGKTPRVFHVTDETKIVKNGAPSTLAEAKVGEDVGGYTEKAADGALTALSVRFGPKPEKGAAAPAPETTATPATEPAAAAPAPPQPKAKRGKKAAAPATPAPAAPAN